MSELLYFAEKGGVSAFDLQVNRAPYGGNCSITPNEGVSLMTKFKIRCDGWRDDTPPLRYSLGKYFLYSE